MEELRLPRLISDGMVFQQKKKVHLWGYDVPGRRVMVFFLGEEYIASADEKGYFEVWLKEMVPGGPYTMQIRDDAGNEKILEDILVGDVFVCSGQSNMELPMARVKDRYPEEIRNCKNPMIRTFKITENGEFHAPLSELLSGEWKRAGQDTILDFSAAAYFFAKQLYQMTGVPVGLINASLGGARIESWMSREMLAGYDEFLELADQYADDAFVEARLRRNLEQQQAWHEKLDQADAGCAEHWEKAKEREAEADGWKKVNLPFFFRETELKGFIGSVWFRRSFTVSERLAGKEAALWLGTIVDSDTVYVNGVKVGNTDYQYPPRKYAIPAGLLKKGENTIVIRVKCENGMGRFTPGKKYAVFNEEEETELQGEWYYKVGARCGVIPETDFVNWKPTGLYNGMMAPCHKYTIGGILWYQGEANTHDPEPPYGELLERLILGYRRNWRDETLPFLYVQLPNFTIDLEKEDNPELKKALAADPDFPVANETEGWPRVREQQRKALSVPGTGMAVAIDLGEDNDLHPQNKKDIGCRLAMLAMAHLYGSKAACSGPEADTLTVEKKNGSTRILIACKNAKNGMYAAGGSKGTAITDFEVQGGDNGWYPAKAQIEGSRILLGCPKEAQDPKGVRYVYANTNKGALIYNHAGFPMSPFVREIG